MCVCEPQSMLPREIITDTQYMCKNPLGPLTQKISPGLLHSLALSLEHTLCAGYLLIPIMLIVEAIGELAQTRS